MNESVSHDVFSHSTTQNQSHLPRLATITPSGPRVYRLCVRMTTRCLQNLPLLCHQKRKATTRPILFLLPRRPPTIILLQRLQEQRTNNSRYCRKEPARRLESQGHRILQFRFTPTSSTHTFLLSIPMNQDVSALLAQLA